MGLPLFNSSPIGVRAGSSLDRVIQRVGGQDGRSRYAQARCALVCRSQPASPRHARPDAFPPRRRRRRNDHPRKLLNALDPSAVGRLASRLPQGSAIVSATNGKTTTAAMVAEILAPQLRLAHNSAARKPPLRRRVDACCRRTAPISACSRWTRQRFQTSPAVRPRALCLGNLFRTSSTATASSSWWPSAGADSSASSIRTPGWSRSTTIPGRRPRTHRGVHFGVDDPRHGSSDCSTQRTPSGASAAERHEFGGLRRAPRGLPLSGLRPCTAAARPRRPGDRARRVGIGLVRPGGRARLDARPSAAPGPLQRLQRPRGGGACRCPGRLPRGDPSGLERFSAAFGRFERIPVGSAVRSCS